MCSHIITAQIAHPELIGIINAQCAKSPLDIEANLIFKKDRSSVTMKYYHMENTTTMDLILGKIMKQYTLHKS